MKKIQKKILAVILSAIVAFSMPTALAVDAYYNLPLDVGNHHRYSGGSRSVLVLALTLVPALVLIHHLVEVVHHQVLLKLTKKQL